MEIGIDSFAATGNTAIHSPAEDMQALSELLERMQHADDVGLDVFAIGEPIAANSSIRQTLSYWQLQLHAPSAFASPAR